MRNILSKTNIFSLLICRSISKFSCNKLVFQFERNKISKDKKKFKKKKKKCVFKILI